MSIISFILGLDATYLFLVIAGIVFIIIALIQKSKNEADYSRSYSSSSPNYRGKRNA